MKIKKEKPTLTVAAVVAPHRGSSHPRAPPMAPPLHHSKVHPPHAAGWRTKSKTTLFSSKIFNCPSIFWSAVSGGWCESEVLSLAQYGRKILFKCGRKLDNVIRFFQRQISTVRPTFWRIATLRHRKFVSLAFWITLIFWNSLRWWVVTYRWKSPSVLKLKHYKNYGSK